MKMQPGKYIPDYLEVQQFIKENINDQRLIIEDAVAILYDYLSKTFQPLTLCVESLVTDARHPEVTVRKY